MRSCFILFALVAVSGCSHTPTIVIPTTEFTDEQRVVIALEDAEVCHCGKNGHHVQVSGQDD